MGGVIKFSKCKNCNAKASKSNFIAIFNNKKVLPCLINSFNVNNPLKAIDTASDKINDKYAFCVRFSDTPDAIYATCKDTPLYIGKGNNHNYITPCLSLVMSKTKQYYLLEKHEIAVVTANNINIYRGEKLIHKQIITSKKA